MSQLSEDAAVRRLGDRLGFGLSGSSLIEAQQRGLSATLKQYLSPADGDAGAEQTPAPQLQWMPRPTQGGRRQAERGGEESVAPADAQAARTAHGQAPTMTSGGPVPHARSPTSRPAKTFGPAPDRQPSATPPTDPDDQENNGASAGGQPRPARCAAGPRRHLDRDGRTDAGLFGFARWLRHPFR